ncbi:glutaredoxin domain-containing protein [Rothia dentocariosa]|jgi:glutaredoxin|uniref:Glutaredoxin-like protein nrdH n=1 Tax=Rothia dentocariosa TaxID=2047 RepID=A0A3S4Z0R8_9MICC|nr:glutaredoxin domain-containing protein [Rothia dentocariosa]VEJ29829.1 Glutaredoxin-like protein nrdH [Rothia dentocariosa]
MTINIYGNNTCAPCGIIKRKLDKLSISYKYFNLDSDPNLADKIKTTIEEQGHENQLPYIEVTGNKSYSFTGLNPHLIERLIEEHSTNRPTVA